MKKSRFLILLSFIFLLKCQSSFASHLMGGEITWTYAKAGADSGKFKFRVKLYRDCNGIVCDPNITLTTNAPNWGGGILCNTISITDISPVGLGCPTCASPSGIASAVQEVIYESTYILISGVPPASGWAFWYASCCRNLTIINLNISLNNSMTLRSIMYPYNNQNTFPAFDESPQFIDHPTLNTNSGSIIQYSNGAIDAEVDSLTFEWAHPEGANYPSPGSNTPFNQGYDFNNPLPDTSFNPLNIAASINPRTGIITFKEMGNGTFATCVKVTSFKCGQKTAEIFRDLQIVISNSIISGTTVNNPPIFFLVQQFPTFINDSLDLEAGDSARFSLSIIDVDPHQNGTAQSISIFAFSNEFGTNYMDTLTGCISPPCAILDRTFPRLNIGITGGANFYWKTACANVALNNGCLQHQRSYLFTFKAIDDFCPTPGINEKTVEIFVHGPVIYLSGNDLIISSNYLSTFNIQWYKDGILIPGATDTIYTPTQGGIYSIIATTPGGCPELSNSVNRTFTGIESKEKTEWELISNYNAEGSINLIVNAANDLQTDFTIFDSKGSLIQSKIIKLENGAQHLILNCGILADGVYHVTMNNSSIKLSSKFLVNKP